MACLVNPRLDEQKRVLLAEQFIALPACCKDELFSQPLLNDLQEAGGPTAMLPTHAFHHDVVLSMRAKISNIEIENNFARASNARTALRGRHHNISSMAAKHVTAEGKLAYCRKALSSQDQTSSRCSSTSGSMYRPNK